MNEFKGTKGEWEIKDSTKIVVGKQPICDTWYFGKINIEEAKCNAKLIACAPDMLELLIRLSDFEPLPGSKEIEQLIKKATEL